MYMTSYFARQIFKVKSILNISKYDFLILARIFFIKKKSYNIIATVRASFQLRFPSEDGYIEDIFVGSFNDPRKVNFTSANSHV